MNTHSNNQPDIFYLWYTVFNVALHFIVQYSSRYSNVSERQWCKVQLRFLNPYIIEGNFEYINYYNHKSYLFIACFLFIVMIDICTNTVLNHTFLQVQTDTSLSKNIEIFVNVSAKFVITFLFLQ